MMSLFQLPLYDVLFPHIFCYLDNWEVWTLRTVCKDLCHICWKFYKNACKSLDIDLASWSSPHTTYSRLTAAVKIFKVCTQLERFSIKVSKDVLQTQLYSIEEELNSLLILLARSPSKITCLHLAGFTMKLAYLPPSPLDGHELFESLSRGFRTVSELTLDNIKCCHGDVSTLWKHCAQGGRLRTFHLINLTLPRNCLSQVGHSNPNLKHFCVAYCYPVSSDGLLEVFRNCSQLESVDMRCVNTVTDRTLHVLAEYCSQLKHLFIDGCSVSDEAVQMLERRGVMMDVQVKQKTKMYKVLGQI